MIRALAVVFAAFCLTAPLAACGDAARLDALASQGKARVVEVVTGDMVRLSDGEDLKLAGVTAPKLDEPYGEASRERLATMVLGQDVELLSAGAARDPFGRKVAQLRLAKGRRWVQGRMLREGAVRVRTGCCARGRCGCAPFPKAAPWPGRCSAARPRGATPGAVSGPCLDTA